MSRDLYDNYVMYREIISLLNAGGEYSIDEISRSTGYAYDLVHDVINNLYERDVIMFDRVEVKNGYDIGMYKLKSDDDE